MTNDVPDTALAHALTTLAAIRPVALTCIGAGAVALLFALLVTGNDPGTVSAFVQTAIMALVGFAATRHYLSGGEEAVLSPVQSLSSPAFLAFLQLELLITAIYELIGALGEATGSFSGLNLPGLILMVFFLAKFGTVFPAIVAGGDTGLEAAAARKTAGAVWPRVMAAYCLGFLLAASIVLLPSMSLEQNAGVGAPVGILLMTPVMVAINVFISVLIAVVLCKAYQGRYRS